MSTGSASAAPITQDGLVNVAASNVEVQIPIAAAANICGIGVNALATALNTGDVTCDASGVSIAEDDNGGSGPVTQRGLVNVALVGVDVDVPVTVAANICGVAVGVLAQAANFGAVDCETEGVALAEAS